MSCYICGGRQDDMKIDARDMKTAPCGTCEAVIQDCLDGYDDPESGEFAYIESSLEDFRDLTAIEDRKFYD